MAMRVEGLTFGGELDLLEGRLNTVDSDLWVIVEADKTFTGTPKPYTLAENWERFAPFHDRIKYVQVVMPDLDPWGCDFWQRDQVGAVLETLNLAEDDLVGLFDVDEWPDRWVENLCAWNMPKYHMGLRWFHKMELTGVMGRWEHFRGQSVNSMRWSRNTLPIVEGGWHFTSMGDLEYLISKVRGFAHTELVSDHLDEQLAHCWTHGHDLADDWFTQLDDLSTLPKWAQDGKFPKDWYRLRP
jgi:hypothetical protein